MRYGLRTWVRYAGGERPGTLRRIRPICWKSTGERRDAFQAWCYRDRKVKEYLWTRVLAAKSRQCMNGL